MTDPLSPSSTPILIVGSGALATLFAARLSAAHYPVTMLGSWAPALQALRRNGARLIDPSGAERAFPVSVIDNAGDCAQASYALVLVKSWQTSRAAGQLAGCLPPDALAVTLQNGLGNYEILAGRLGKDRVALGTTTTGATSLGPGFVKPAGNGEVAVEDHPRVGRFAAALQSAGFEVERVDDASALVWSKLIINSAINPLTALLGVPNGELLNRPAARALMRALAEETKAVALAEGVQLHLEDPVAAAEAVARHTAANHSSMLQDIRRGAPTEIDAICGQVVLRGKRNNVPTPLNEACWQLVTALTQRQDDGSGLAAPSSEAVLSSPEARRT